MAFSEFFTGQLYQRISDDLHLAGVNLRTHAGYLRAVRPSPPTSPQRLRSRHNRHSVEPPKHLTRRAAIATGRSQAAERPAQGLLPPGNPQWHTIPPSQTRNRAP